MLRSADRDGQASRAQPAPPHARHGISRMNCSSRSRARVRVGLGVPPLDVRDHALVRWSSTSAAARTGSCTGRRSPRPSRTGRRRAPSSGASSTGCRVESRARRATASSTRYQYSTVPLAHGASAPSSIDRSGSGTTSSGVDLEPDAEAVAGLARAVRRVEREVPRAAARRTRARRTCTRAPGEKVWIVLAASCVCTAIAAMPLGQLRAPSRSSRRPAAGCPAWRPAGRRRPRSCACSCLGSRIGSASSRTSPSIRRAANPLPRQVASRSFSYSPLRPRTTGASTWNRVPSGSCMHLVDDLLGRLAADRPAAVGAVRVPDPGVEHAGGSRRSR